MGRMTQQELVEFLARVEVCKLACLEPDGWPYVVPCVCFYRDSGFYVGTRDRSAWGQYLRRDGRVSLSLEEGDRRAQVQGRAERIEGPVMGTGKLYELFKERYAAGWETSHYFQSIARYEPMWGFFIRPERITAWQGGEWARRYKHADW